MKRLILALMLVAMIAFMANAQSLPVPPAHGGYAAGWGMNPTNWDTAYGSYNSGLGLYDPGALMGGGGWYVWSASPPGYIVYAPITLELWIEMSCIQTYEYLNYQWHRLGAGDTNSDIVFYITGTVQSNEALWVSLTEKVGYDPLGLEFIHNNGVGDDSNMNPLLPISWRARWGNGLTPGLAVQYGFTAVSWTGTSPNRLITIPDWWSGLGYGSMPACDHWFQFEGTIDLEYHEADGYYMTMYGGCPDPGL